MSQGSWLKNSFEEEKKEGGDFKGRFSKRNWAKSVITRDWFNQSDYMQIIKAVFVVFSYSTRTQVFTGTQKWIS